MKTHIKDGLQIFAALFITGSMVVSAAPLPTETSSQPVNQNLSAPAENTQPIQEASQTSAEPSQIVPAPEKVVTWQDNPNGCTDAQYIAKDAPFNCIDKPVAAAPATTAPVKTTNAIPSGGCLEWMAAAGVPYNSATQQLILNESGCRPNAVNPSSGACGIPQALPCSKMPCTLEDPVCQLRWMAEYVRGRYNTWEGALSFWHCKGTCYSNLGPVYNKTTNWY